jgi:outer membrane protein assembly factor BamB
MPRLSVLAFVLAALAIAAASAPPAGNWPSFRGTYAAGTADGQNLPDRWDGAKGDGVLWKVRIPGLAHSSPIVWGDRIYVTTAISSAGEATFKHGLFGDGDASPDRSSHQWKLLCLDARTGRVVWEKTAHEGVPKEKRHVKSTYANATPATDGRHIVTFFGSHGVHGFDVAGRRLWTRDLGFLDVGAYDAPEYEWGTASSPIIDGSRVIVQVDTQKEDYLLALDLSTGRTVWRAERDELPSWGTPTVFPDPKRPQIVTNGSKFIRGYDPATGKELWRLGGSSQITAPTPIWSRGLLVVASGRRPEAPIFVIRSGASGDITLAAGKTTSDQVAWSRQQRGPYMPTPLVYGNVLYVIGNAGIFDCYELESGKEIYRQRLAHQGGGFSASPVAADGRIYLSSEDGDIFVVKAGTAYELLATNGMGERLMATPALSSGRMFVRGERHLFAIGRKQP